MHPTTYTAADALAYLREALHLKLEWIHEALAETYGVEMIDGEEYLPEALNEIMNTLYDILSHATYECVTVGDYQRRGGQLYQPRRYSNGVLVYDDSTASEAGCPIPVHQLHHPAGNRLPFHRVETGRTYLHVVEDGTDCA